MCINYQLIPRWIYTWRFTEYFYALVNLSFEPLDTFNKLSDSTYLFKRIDFPTHITHWRRGDTFFFKRINKVR